MRRSQLHERGDQLLDALADLERCPTCRERLPCWRAEHSTRRVRELLAEAATVIREALGRPGPQVLHHADGHDGPPCEGCPYPLSILT